MYDSFDILPILNWHNFLKSGDYAWFLFDRSQKKTFTDKEFAQNYENLINSLGARKLLNGYYSKCLQSFLIWQLVPEPQSEQAYNNDFFAYLKVLQETVEEYLIDAYKRFYNTNGHLESLIRRCIDFHWNNFPEKLYNFNFFADLAMIETFLKISIDPVKTSVNHYNAIKNEAIRKSQK